MTLTRRERDYESKRQKEPLPADALEQLRDTPTAVVSDALHVMGVTPHTIVGLRPLASDGAATKLLGRAVTVEYAPMEGEDHHFSQAPYLAYTVIKESEEGDVVVLAVDDSPYAVFGDNMARMGASVGIGGVLIDGRVRDVDGILPTGVPTFCVGASPEAYLHHLEAVKFNEPVDIRGITVAPGDLIVGDLDGVVVAPGALVSDLARTVREMRELADWVVEALAGGMSPEDMYVESDRRRAEMARR